MKEKGSVLVFILIVGALIVGIFIYSWISSSNKSSSSLPHASFNPSIAQSPRAGKLTKSFQSKDLKFVINYDGNLTIEDKGITTNFISEKGAIKISRSGTDFTDIESHLSNFDKLRAVTSIKSQQLTINGFSSLKRRENTPDGQREAYYIMVDAFIYTFSTSSPDLYNDLDQIAKSFKYAGK